LIVKVRERLQQVNKKYRSLKGKDLISGSLGGGTISLKVEYKWG
jgi:hypothetical protein